jgi:hypothetical protein
MKKATPRKNKSETPAPKKIWVVRCSRETLAMLKSKNVHPGALL